MLVDQCSTSFTSYPHQHKCLRCNIFPYKGLNPRPYSKRSAQNDPMTRRKKLGVAHSLTGGCLLMGNPCSLRLLLYQYSTSTSTRTRWCSSKGNNHDIKIPKIRLKLLRRMGTMDPHSKARIGDGRVRIPYRYRPALQFAASIPPSHSYLNSKSLPTLIAIAYFLWDLIPAPMIPHFATRHRGRAP